MLKGQQEYWKLMSNSEKATEAVQRLVDGVEKGVKSKDDFQKMFDKSFRLQEVAKESEEDYKKLIEITNKKWGAFEEQLGQIYKQANLNDHSR